MRRGENGKLLVLTADNKIMYFSDIERKNKMIITRENWVKNFKEIIEEITNRSEQIRAELKKSPNDFELIRKRLNPDRNGTIDNHMRLARCLEFCHKGEIKPHWLTEWHSSSMRLIDYLAENFPEMSSVNHCDTTQVRLYRLLCDPDEAYADEMWHEKIRHYMSVLKDCYRKNSDTAMCLAVKAKEGNKLVSMPTKSKGRNWMESNQQILYRRDETQRIIAVIRKRYERAKGRLSYMCIVRQMMMSEEYKNSMKIKSANTWVVQASSKRRG